MAVFLDKANRHIEKRDFIQAARSQYVITDVGVQAVQMAVGFTSFGEEKFGKELYADMTADDVQREFEREVLGLEPLPNGDGLHYWESSAGFTGGTYPIKPFADFVGIDTQDLSDILHDEHAVRFGHVILRSGDFIVPVKHPSHGDTSLVSANRAIKLSEKGNALVDLALRVADYSTL